MTKIIKNREIEVRFLDIDYPKILEKLLVEGAENFGEDLLREIIFYDKELTWMYKKKSIVRVRQTKNGIFMTYKHKESDSDIASKEIEFEVSNAEQAKEFLEEVGLVAYREQEKKRHTLKLGEVIIDIDTWPSVPTYVELEGPNEKSLKECC